MGFLLVVLRFFAAHYRGQKRKPFPVLWVEKKVWFTTTVAEFANLKMNHECTDLDGFGSFHSKNRWKEKRKIHHNPPKSTKVCLLCKAQKQRLWTEKKTKNTRRTSKIPTWIILKLQICKLDCSPFTWEYINIYYIIYTVNIISFTMQKCLRNLLSRRVCFFKNQPGHFPKPGSFMSTWRSKS